MPGVKAPPAVRFWAKVDTTGSCWIWTASKMGYGYGKLRVAGKDIPAHRFAYALLVGPIPEGLVLDHRCGNPACVNPGHLDPVSQRENVLRGSSPPALAARATHCPSGHEYDDPNTYRARDGARQCRLCHRDRERARRARIAAHGRVEALTGAAGEGAA